MAFDVFISYSRKDHVIAKIVYELLQQHGLEPWIDEKSIPEGVLWKKELYKKAQEVEIVILLMSEASEESRWVTSEITLADSKEIPIFPIALEEKYADIGKTKFAIISDRQAALLYKEDNILSYLNKLIQTRIKPQGFIELNRKGKSRSIDSSRLAQFDRKVSNKIGSNRDLDVQARSEGLIRRLMVDGCFELHYSRKGWTQQDLNIVPVDTPEIDPEVLNIISEREKQAQEEGDKLPFREKYELVTIEGDFIDDPEVRIKLARRNWGQVVRAAESLDEIQLHFKNSGRRLRLFDIENAHIPNMLVSHILVITKDNYLLLCQRTGRPYYLKWHWGASIEEQLAEEDGPNLFSATIRGVNEELFGLHDLDDRYIEEVKAFSFFREFYSTPVTEMKSVHVLNTGVVTHVNLNIEFDEVWEYLQYARDKEIENMIGLPVLFQPVYQTLLSPVFDPGSLIDHLKIPMGTDLKFVQNEVIYNQWHKSTKIRLISLLRKEFYSEFNYAIDQDFYS
jgi:hypothetical protein